MNEAIQESQAQTQSLEASWFLEAWQDKEAVESSRKELQERVVEEA